MRVWQALECLAPCGQDRFGGPLIHERLLSADNLFHCFARLGVSAFRTISRAKSRARRMSPRAPRNDHIGAPWTRMRGPCTGPFGPIPSPRTSRRTNLVRSPRDYNKGTPLLPIKLICHPLPFRETLLRENFKGTILSFFLFYLIAFMWITYLYRTRKLINNADRILML